MWGGTHVPTKESKAPLQRVLWRSYEALAGQFSLKPAERRSCASIAEEFDLPLLSSVVALHRVRLLLRQADCGFEAFFGMWQSLRDIPGSWPDLVLSDLEALQKREVKLAALPNPRSDVDAWIAFMQQHRASWKLILRRNYMCYTPETAEAREEVAKVCIFQCRHCEARFDTEAHRASHEHRAHKVLSLAGQWAVGRSCCPACCVQFHAPERLAKHFRYSHECLRAVVSFFHAPKVKEDEEKQATTNRRKLMKSIGRGSEFADFPAWRVSGPCIPKVSEPHEGTQEHEAFVSDL